MPPDAKKILVLVSDKTKISEFVFLIIFSLLSNICYGDSLVKTKLFSENLCKFPENISIFQNFMIKNFGNEISGIDLKSLKINFNVEKERHIIDPVYSKNKKVNYTGLSKSCRAADGVEYKYVIGVITTKQGSPIYHQYDLVYDIDIFLEKKRKFRFENVYASKKEYAKILESYLIGSGKKEVDAYLKSIGCNFLEAGHNTPSYVFSIDPRKDLSSRIFSWNFSKKIIVYLDDNAEVNKVNVKEYR